MGFPLVGLPRRMLQTLVETFKEPQIHAHFGRNVQGTTDTRKL